ncbi:uncharacterized protein RMCC_4064 [Mycolicibacterium canariasense]|uniref:Uncharacterized protein n=1 Tax=Mycolicibacterium canariasense TaxID=228230 RepID=A0A124E2K5_MYCCR|nr:hypothetical protein [Mycolicibacterium canariasense]MCV7213460.1 hypothetical protein [Mycolicibacterium canariasense]ORV09016.1 hypothetical protein AWB94_10510 [Mycolicibacterium canariasense]GAS97098.1 uncharacterized protein RMCC_4064 [Mycolicibacterium canariasense]
MSLAAEWSSLRDELALADALYGPRGPAMVDRWFAEQVDRTSDMSFAREFADHIDLPGVRMSDYLHRRIRSSAGKLLGGIRFYGRDITRPFVEILAHDFDDLDALRACVRREWAMFAPPFLRVRAAPGRIAGAGVLLDESVFAARYRDIRAAGAEVRLRRFDRVEDAERMVAQRYARLGVDDPALARNISPASAADLRQWDALDQLRALHTAHGMVGLLAVAPGQIDWITGDVINEEVVCVAHRGHGFATAGQAAWAAEPGRDPGQWLIGTIDRLNTASRKTAVAAGRRRVLDAFFVSTDPRAG